MNPAEQYIYNQQEPYQSIMFYVRSIIMKTLPEVEEKFKYRIPFYIHNKKAICYLNILKGMNYVDVAFVQGIYLESKYPELKDANNRKQVRSLQVKSLEGFDEPMFVNLLKDAVIHLDKSKKAWHL